MTPKKNHFDQWIFETFSVSAEGLGLLRIFTSLFILFFLIPGQGGAHFSFLSEMPGDFFAPPPGPMLLLDGFPDYAVFQVLHTLLLFSLIGMLFGYFTKTASIISGITILMLQGLIFSIGKVNHELLIATVPIIMSFSNWGAAFSIDSVRKGSANDVHAWPLTMLALIIGFMMFTAGFPKVLGGWLDPATQATQGHLFNQVFVRERDALLALWFINLDNVVFWELLDWATVFFEIVFLAAVASRKWFQRFICLAVCFHFSTMMMLNIAFLPNFIAYAVFLNWTAVYESNLQFYQRITGKKGMKSKKRSVWYLSGILLLFFSSLRYLSSKDLMLSGSDLMMYEVVLVTIALIMVVFFVVRDLTAVIPTTHRG